MKSRVLAVMFLLAGSAAAQVEAGRIDMTSLESTQLEGRFRSSVKLQRGYASSAMISASDLRIPARARKEFDRAGESLRKQNYTKALQQLNDAVSIYPPFASAYNNLGVIYARLGDSAHGRQALETAIDLNDHFALAYVNLGRMNIASADYAGARSALEKASILDASDPVTLILLTYSELMLGHLQQAIASSQKAHALERPHAFAHRLAARALEQEGQVDAAIAELKLSLAEEPAGPLADAARNELAIVQAIPR
jgi:Flp pilus assembly protein TadD